MCRSRCGCATAVAAADLTWPADDPPPSPAAAARNWRTVLAVDLALGLVPLVAGTVAVLIGWTVVGASVASLGLGYLLVVVRRGRRWSAWRRRNGLGRP